MMLYSFKGGMPSQIPFRITLQNGFTRTDPSTFTQEDLNDAGYIGPYEELSYDSKIEVLDWNGNEYIKRPYNNEEIQKQWGIIRLERDRLLKESDYTQINDYEFVTPNKEDWGNYRQILRDLPEVQTNPFDILWPPDCYKEIKIHKI